MVSWSLIWPIAFFMIFGIMNALSVKLAFEVEAQGLPKYGVHLFQKPWFMTTLCFVGMALAIIPYIFMTLKDRKKYPSITTLTWKQFFEYAIPAFSDLFQGIVSAVTVCFIGVSIDCMMKSGTLIGVCLITKFVMKKHLYMHEWIGAFIVIIALILVGCSSFLNTGSIQIRVSLMWCVVIIALKIVSQVGYAVKITYEEYLTHTYNHHPILVVGLEGLWSTFMCAGIFMPIAQFLPGEEGNGIREDTIDSFVMIGNSGLLVGIVVVSIALGLVYNVVSVTITDRSSALVRTLAESARTFLIWGIQLIIFYTFRESESLYHYREIGEQFSKGSYMQIAGYVIMTFGILQYKGYPKFSCMVYRSKDEEDEESSRRLSTVEIIESPLMEEKGAM